MIHPIRAAMPHRRSPIPCNKMLGLPGIRRGALCVVVAAILLTGCSNTDSSSSCVFVARKHLANGSDGDGETLVCSPLRVLSAYRDQYFPDSSTTSEANDGGS